MDCPLCLGPTRDTDITTPDGRFHSLCDELWLEGHRVFPSIAPEDMPCDDDACPGTYCGSHWRVVESGCDKPCCGGDPGPAVTTERERAEQARATVRSDRRWRE